MTPRQIYTQLPIVEETKELWDFYGSHDHFPEIMGHLVKWDLATERNTRITIKKHVDHNFDHRRAWRIASVWLDDTPVMVITNAGREGDDYGRRYITDRVAFDALLAYIDEITQERRSQGEDVVDPDEEIDALTSFYRCRLDLETMRVVPCKEDFL